MAGWPAATSRHPGGGQSPLILLLQPGRVLVMADQPSEPVAGGAGSPVHRLHQLAARTAEMLPADHSRTATEEEKEGEAVEVVVAEGRMANSIRNYFMPTASQQQEEGIRQPHRYGQFCEFDLDSNTCIK